LWEFIFEEGWNLFLQKKALMNKNLSKITSYMIYGRIAIGNIGV